MPKTQTERATLSFEEIEGIADKNVQIFARHLFGNIVLHRDHLRQFAAEVATDPHHALSWSGRAFEAAAALKITERLEDVLANVLAGNNPRITEATFLVEIRRALARDVLHASASIEASTSAVANLMERYTLAARARLLELVEGLLESAP